MPYRFGAESVNACESFFQRKPPNPTPLKVKIESFPKCRVEQSQALKRVVLSVSAQQRQIWASAAPIVGAGSGCSQPKKPAPKCGVPIRSPPKSHNHCGGVLVGFQSNRHEKGRFLRECRRWKIHTGETIRNQSISSTDRAQGSEQLIQNGSVVFMTVVGTKRISRPGFARSVDWV